MLSVYDHRLRRWSNIVPTLASCLVSAGKRPVLPENVSFYPTPLATPGRAAVFDCGLAHIQTNVTSILKVLSRQNKSFWRLIVREAALWGVKYAGPGPVFSYKLRYIVGFRLVEMAISTNRKPTIYRNLRIRPLDHILTSLVAPASDSATLSQYPFVFWDVRPILFQCRAVLIC